MKMEAIFIEYKRQWESGGEDSVHEDSPHLEYGPI